MEHLQTTFRYNTKGHWYKGNTHIHSNASDGGMDFPEIAALYHAADYDFLFRTDHWVLSDSWDDMRTYPLLWLDGIELDGVDRQGSYLHVVCLGQLAGLNKEDGIDAALHSARQQGALTILAHPHWCGSTLEDVKRWQFDGIEVYNHVCHWLNGKSNGLVHWDAALKQNPNALAFTVDDSHLRPEHPGWNGGWIMVNTQECSPSSIMDAIRRGNFYSTCGPEIHSITVEEGELHLSTSPVKFIRLVGPDWRGSRAGSFDGSPITQARFPLPLDWQYMYLEIEDASGRRAWTNNLFVIEP